MCGAQGRGAHRPPAALLRRACRAERQPVRPRQHPHHLRPCAPQDRLLSGWVCQCHRMLLIRSNSKTFGKLASSFGYEKSGLQDSLQSLNSC